MKWLLALVACVVVGCNGGMPPETKQAPERWPADPNIVEVSECTVDDIEKTVLPAVSEGDVEIMCTHCDNGCDALGEPCGEYGAPCSAAGHLGVCVSCCSGAVGELHCKTVESHWPTCKNGGTSLVAEYDDSRVRGACDESR